MRVVAHAVLAAICPFFPQVAAVAQAPATITGEFAHASGARHYRLFLPGSARSPARAMVVMLHGCAQTADELARLSRMDEAAQRGEFAVLYPEQALSANPLRCWNWFLSEHQRRDTGEPAIIASMIRQLAADHELDSTRVHIVGISAGGGMAATLAVAYPELIAGLALHSTVPYRSATSVEGALAIMRGDLGDEAAGARLARLVADEMGARRRDIPVVVLHGSEDPVVRAQDGEAAAAQWRRSNRQAPVEFLRIDGLAHAWSGGAAGEKYAAPETRDATAYFVDFFTLHAALGKTPREK